MDDKTWKVNKTRFLNKINNIDASFCTTHPSNIKYINKKNIFFIPNPVDQLLKI